MKNTTRNRILLKRLLGEETLFEILHYIATSVQFKFQLKGSKIFKPYKVEAEINIAH